MNFLKWLQLGALLFIAWVYTGTVRGENPPNIVYIMSDELAYFELGHMGNPYIKTPRIDQMAREGMRFTNALAGSPVCAPLRCNLMTGKHAGHASVRANDGGTPLRADEAGEHGAAAAASTHFTRSSRRRRRAPTVSYTHLTLPTKRIV